MDRGNVLLKPSRLGSVANAYNLNYSGGRDGEESLGVRQKCEALSKKSGKKE
jgi:hypothetical protein